ncbi:MAG: hypothetical protein BroJett040_04370 [Oligoflexia bacterium]|nr:MAG: hypothetical protein BroJett040_04370 [Oligoflexia bacterium]
MNTCDMDKNSETKAFTDNADKAAKAYATAQQGGAISSCNEMRQVAAAANTALATLKAQCSVVVSECNRVCNGDQITGTKLCSQASARVKDADMNTTQAVIGFQDQQCDTLQKALSGLAGGSGGGDGISGKMYVPSSNLSNALPGMKSPSGASSYASTGNTVGGSTGGPSQKGLGATDLGSLMNTDEDAIYGDSQTAAGKAGGSGGGSGLGGNSGGGGGGPGKQQKGVASRPGLNTNINRGFVGSSAMPGFGGPGGVGAAGGGVGGPNGRPGIGPNGQQPDWRKFLPGGQYDPRRGIAGVTGPDGITGPATNLFDKVHNRYGAVGHSLKP